MSPLDHIRYAILIFLVVYPPRRDVHPATSESQQALCKLLGRDVSAKQQPSLFFAGTEKKTNKVWRTVLTEASPL